MRTVQKSFARDVLYTVIVCIAIAFFLTPSELFAWGMLKGQEDPGPGLYVQEQDTPYRQKMGQIKDHIDQNRAENFVNMILWKHICKLEEDIRRASDAMAKMKRLQSHMELIKRGGDPRSSFNYYVNPLEMYDAEPDLTRIQLSEHYVSVWESKVITPSVIMEAPVWMPPEKSASSPSLKSRFPRIIKVSQNRFDPTSKAGALENMVYDIAKVFLPDKMLVDFDAGRLAAWLMTKAGVREVGEGVISRPATFQDKAFRRYANLGNTIHSQTLFWSDPMVLGGYHPILGATLNKTPLHGYRSIDMDNAASRGYSGLIDKWNRGKPFEQQKKNPFKGYAAKVIPGLIIMGKQGRLTPGEPPSDGQLKEAIDLTKKLALLPSQNLKAGKIPASFKFNYPAQVILVDGEEENSKAVELPAFEKETYKRSMMMARDRLNEIRRLMEANRLGRQYVQTIIESYIAWEEESIAVTLQLEAGWDYWSPTGLASPSRCIPEIALLRRDIQTSIEHHRRLLSKLENQYDDLRQKEWVILGHIMETRRQAVTFLMEQASIRDEVLEAQETFAPAIISDEEILSL